jgi:hypothetical protein
MIEFLFWLLVLPVSIAFISLYLILHHIIGNWLERKLERFLK